MAQGLFTPDPSLNPTHLSIMRGHTTTTHYTHHQVSLMVSRNTTLVPSLGLRIGPACEAGFSTGMRRERVPPGIRKKERNNNYYLYYHFYSYAWYTLATKSSVAETGDKSATKSTVADTVDFVAGFGAKSATT